MRHLFKQREANREGSAQGVEVSQARRREREVRELEARLRNPWRQSKGRDGALEAWG